MLSSTFNAQSFPQADPVEPVMHFRRDYLLWRKNFSSQPVLVQQFLLAQAKEIAEAIVQGRSSARVVFPALITIDYPITPLQIQKVYPEEKRQLQIGGLLERLKHQDLFSLLSQYLDEMESCEEIPVAHAASLVRYSLARYLIYTMLPMGRSISYMSAKDEDIPTIPVEGQSSTCSYADTFYIPEWMVTDEQAKMLVQTEEEGLSVLASMQNYLRVLQLAVRLAPYFVVDEIYQKKQYGMLGQYVNQGRAFAQAITGEIVETLQRRIAENDLNRGLSISLPYFDDQALELKNYEFVVIPAGRIPFRAEYLPSAAKTELANVACDSRFSPSTRKYLCMELRTLGHAFESPADVSISTKR